MHRLSFDSFHQKLQHSCFLNFSSLFQHGFCNVTLKKVMWILSLLKNITLLVKDSSSSVVKSLSVISAVALVYVNSSAQDLSISQNKEVVSYLSSRFQTRITNVIVDKDNVTIKGNVSGNQTGLYLCELAMYQETKLAANSFISVTPIDARKPDF